MSQVPQAPEVQGQFCRRRPPCIPVLVLTHPIPCQGVDTVPFLFRVGSASSTLRAKHLLSRALPQPSPLPTLHRPTSKAVMPAFTTVLTPAPGHSFGE